MEIWKDIKNYEGLYQISNLGNVKSYHKRSNGNLLKLPIKRGYYQVGLRKNGTRKYYQVHRLVAETFIENKDNLPQVNHKDENKLNNNVDNLEWCTVSYNNTYGSRIERVVASNKNRQPVVLYDINGNFIAEYFSIMDAVRKTKINPSCIVASCQGKRKQPRKYIWKYKSEVVVCP